jgi:hypothetical protein
MSNKDDAQRDGPVFYQSGELARLVGISRERLYEIEKLGVLKPKRLSSGARLYNSADLKRLMKYREKTTEYRERAAGRRPQSPASGG